MPARIVFPLAFLLGALAACGFAPLDLWPLTIGCLCALIALLERTTRLRRALALGWWFGFGHFCIGNNWIATAFTYQAAMPAWLGWVAVVLLSLYLALYPAIALGLAWLVAGRGTTRRPRPVSLAFALGGAWTVGEWLRATMFTGFAWNPLAEIWLPTTLLPETTRVIGTYGLSGLTLLIAALILALVRRIARGRTPQRRAVAVLLLGGLAALSLAPRKASSRDAAAGPAIHIVQPNINQAEKWQEGFKARNFERLVSLTGKPGPEPRLILWPEVAVPEFLEEDAPARQRLAALLGPRDLLLTGGIALRYDKSGDLVAATNSLFGLDPTGRLLGRYDKSHLVPYGEYLPMRPILSRLGLSRLAPGDMDFDAGPGPRDLTLPGIGKMGVQICYEIIFSGHVVDTRDRPRFLFNPSNDAWFGAWGPPQHLAQARLRAIEEAMPIIRATPTGISAVIDAEGQLIAALPWHSAGAIDARLPPPGQPTLFARFGNILPLALAALLLLLGFATRRRAG